MEEESLGSLVSFSIFYGYSKEIFIDLGSDVPSFLSYNYYYYFSFDVRSGFFFSLDEEGDESLAPYYFVKLCYNYFYYKFILDESLSYSEIYYLFELLFFSPGDRVY